MQDLITHLQERISLLENEMKRIVEEGNQTIESERREISARDQRLQQFILQEQKRVDEMKGRVAELYNLRSELELETVKAE